MEKFQNQLSKLRSLLDITFFRVLLFLILGIVLYASMYSNIKPEKVNIKLFSVADQTIRSPITIEDKESTEKKKKEAEDQIEDVYVLNKEITENRVDLIKSIFDASTEVKEDIIENREKAIEKDATNVKEPSISEQVELMKAKLTEDVTKEVSDDVFSTLLQASDETIASASDLTVTAINNVMSNRIPANQVENAKKRVEEELKYTNLDKDVKNAAIELGRFAVLQNEFYDSGTTKERRQQAIEAVEPVRILQGQIIVEENQLISRDIYRQLKLVGFLDNEIAIQPFIGLGLLVIIILMAHYYYFFETKVDKEKMQNQLLIFSIIFIINILLMKAISLLQQLDYSEIGYIFPVALGAILIRVLIDERLAIQFTIVLALCGSIMFNEGITGNLNINIGIYIICGGIAGILFLSKQSHRSKILGAGMFAAVINLIVIFSLIFIKNGQFGLSDFIFYFIAALISGAISGVLSIGLLPFFESSFGILSAMRLIELSNPNHPLLRKILMEAPGTYHHSVMVANLAESACEAIGANGLLARVGCYYHDIGKTKRPQLFIENQMNIENPHDRLPPQTSKNIIISHTKDGAEMLRKYKMPKEIIDVAEQHHGTTLIKYFYYKAKESGMDVKEEDYRYPGPKPQSKENAIIGIADSLEAAVRSMRQPNPEQIEGLVKSIIADRLNDGQLNECNLTLRELEIVANTLCETLKGIFHSRIEYPEMTKQKVKQA
ncbi:HD family phosphohydrolase [Bacillus massilinigeriensis]|uniref:HD family phosphohydrolase n=1 Tax=Bacillus massilionigeriensis TaxID=1805475 RepID=UPI00096AEE2C|nr:HD family phosphohydrolase [Bacillus massilionigeriensis]